MIGQKLEVGIILLLKICLNQPASNTQMYPWLEVLACFVAYLDIEVLHFCHSIIFRTFK